MKHLKHINELLKSTLVSAADKAYKYGHHKRYNRFLNHADKKGENVPVDKIFPHAFSFENVKNSNFTEFVSPHTEDSNPPYFYITDWKFTNDSIIKGNYSVDFKVMLKSNYGRELFIDLHIYDNLELRTWLEMPQPKIGQYFNFKNRKDAVQFKKFLIEDLTPEFLEDIEKYTSFDNKTCDYILDKLDNGEDDDMFFYLDGDGTPSAYIGFIKNIPINSMIEDI